jgi:hypothetical protein
MSAAVKPVTASLNVNVTSRSFGLLNPPPEFEIVSVGGVVSPVLIVSEKFVDALLTFPAASVAVAENV